MIDNGNCSNDRKRKKRTPGTVRVIIVFLALVAQVLLLVYFVGLLKQNAVYLYFLLEIAGAATIMIIVANDRNSSYTIFWLIVMAILPVVGYLLFLFWGTTGLTSGESKRIRRNIKYSMDFLEQDPQIYDDFLFDHPFRRRLGTYLANDGFPIYQNTQCSYYPVGELQFEHLVKDIEQARKFIFLEYYIISEGQLWDRIHDILVQKAQKGVEVRVMLDDFGSLRNLSDNFVKELRHENIQAARFNPVHVNIFSLLINYRNHQKIAIIDGNIGYTGGTNIADEYANITHRLGHWKDSSVRLEGDAVWGLTVTFLQMWDAVTDSESDYCYYKPDIMVEGTGYYQPFADSPVNNPLNPAEETYSQIIANAQQYVYITTPYLVVDNAMKDILCMAAKGGIDVRIVTPRVWDHWYVHMVTQSNYDDLLAGGIRIYEYSPGFIHSKIILSDDDNAVIGSINMDYRSFFLHFENAVWICGSPILQDIKDDMLHIFSVSQEIHLDEWRKRPRHIKLLQGLLRVFAPLF